MSKIREYAARVKREVIGNDKTGGVAIVTADGGVI